MPPSARRLQPPTAGMVQAMAAATEQMMQTRWRPGAQRDIYADFNALTLDVTTRALFGSNLPASESRQITGEPARHACSANAVGGQLPRWLPASPTATTAADLQGAVSFSGALCQGLPRARRTLRSSVSDLTACVRTCLQMPSAPPSSSLHSGLPQGLPYLSGCPCRTICATPQQCSTWTPLCTASSGGGGTSCSGSSSLGHHHRACRSDL